jgi:uncharacterized membrane protein
MPTHRPRWVPWVTVPAAVAGLGASTYLAYAHYTEPATLACPDRGFVNCAKVTTSPESMLFGVVPMAVLGAVFFAVMVALTLPAVWSSARRELDVARVGAAVAGVVGVLYLVYVEVVRLRALCLWCTAVHVCAFAVFVGVLAGTLLADDTDDAPVGAAAPVTPSPGRGGSTSPGGPGR